MYNIYIVRLPCRLFVLWWKPGDEIQPDLKVLYGTSIYNWRWYLVPFPDGFREEGMLVCVLLGSDLSESMVSSCSGVPCCVIGGWFNGNQLMVDLVAHNKCSWCLSCNLSPSMRKFLVPRVRASFISNKCGHFLQYLQYISWVFSSKTTQGNLSIHEFWNVFVRFFLSYLKGYCLLKS